MTSVIEELEQHTEIEEVERTLYWCANDRHWTYEGGPSHCPPIRELDEHTAKTICLPRKCKWLREVACTVYRPCQQKEEKEKSPPFTWTFSESVLLLHTQSRPSSGKRVDTVSCPLCFTEHTVLPNQQIVFCENCDYIMTNELSLQQEDT